MKPTKNPALTRDALYSKSQVYIRRGLRAQTENDTEEYQLWASLALELLGKAALSKVHPSLVADPLHANSLFAACGRQLSADIKTITAKTLFERLSHLEKKFDSRHQKFCEQMALRRNAELHSGESPFSGMTPVVWEREFWGAIELVLMMQGETLESWLGATDSKAPARIIKQATEATKWAVTNRIKRCKDDFEEKFPNKAKREIEIQRAVSLPWNSSNWDAFDRCECPACGSLGFVAGDFWDEEIIEKADPDHFEDENGDWHTIPGSETVDRIYNVELFDCLICGLRLESTKEIAAGDISSEFSKTQVRNREFEPEYGND